MGEFLKRLWLILLVLGLPVLAVYFAKMAMKDGFVEMRADMWAVAGICLAMSFSFLRYLLKPTAKKYTREQLHQAQSKRRKSPVLWLVGGVFAVSEVVFDVDQYLFQFFEQWIK